jgi:hypothetical protein
MRGGDLKFSEPVVIQLGHASAPEHLILEDVEAAIARSTASGSEAIGSNGSSHHPRRRRVVGDRVDPVAAIEGVRTAAALERLVAAHTLQAVVAAVADDEVALGRAGQQVVALVPKNVGP